MLPISYTALYTYKNTYICVLAILLCLNSDLQANNGTEPTDVRSSKTVSFELVDGLIIVKAQFEGQTGNFVLDTGAPTLLLNKKVEAQEFDVWSPSGVTSSQEIQIKEFEFGVVKKTDVIGWAMDLSPLEEKIDLPIAGIVGNDIWDNHQVIIDFKNKLITFHRKGDAVSITSSDYHIASLPWVMHDDELRVVKLEVNGRLRNMAFDTGAGINVLDVNEADSDQHFGEAKIDQITIKELPFVQHDLSNLNNGALDINIDGILSASSLQTDIAVLDFSNNRLHLCWEKQPTSN